MKCRTSTSDAGETAVRPVTDPENRLRKKPAYDRSDLRTKGVVRIVAAFHLSTHIMEYHP